MFIRESSPLTRPSAVASLTDIARLLKASTLAAKKKAVTPQDRPTEEA